MFVVLLHTKICGATWQASIKGVSSRSLSHFHFPALLLVSASSLTLVSLCLSGGSAVLMAVSLGMLSTVAGEANRGEALYVGKWPKNSTSWLLGVNSC